jgi:hypothetical protein
MSIASMKTTCQSCGWSSPIQNQGDVLFTPQYCERCGSEQLIQESAGTLPSKVKDTSQSIGADVGRPSKK